MNSDLRQQANLYVLGGMALILMAVITAAVGLIVEGRDEVIADSKRQAQRFVSGAEVALNRALLGVDVMLADTTGLLQTRANGTTTIDVDRTNRQLRGAVNQNLLVHQVLFVNEQGAILASSEPGRTSAELKLPKGFLSNVTAQTIPTLAISEPTTSFSSAEKVLYFARPIAHDHNNVIAIAEVEVPPLATILAQGVDIEGLAVTLERGDGLLLVGVPANDALSGTHITPPLDADIANGGIRLAPSRMGGAPAIVAYRPALYGGLLIAASIPLDSALADWRVERNRIVTVAVVFALMILLAGGTTTWYLARLKQTRAQADSAKQTLEQALDSMTSGFVLLDARDRIVSWNRRFIDIYPWLATMIEPGIPFEHVFDTAARELLPGADDEQRQAWIKRRRELHRSAQGEHEQQLPNGQVVLVTERRTPDGGMVCVYSDISEKKRIEVDLRIAAIAFEVQEGITITDADENIVRVNRAFTEITGYSPEEAVGKRPKLLCSARHDSHFFAAMWNSIESTGGWQGEIWNRRKNGEEYPSWLMITAVKDETGRVTHYVGTFMDITERKAAADEINTLAFYDSLTQLPNRRLLRDRLGQALAASTRSERHGALLFIDLDYFKVLNDTLGHDIGDQLLQEVAHRLVGCVREGDTVARLGGDEFVVMLEDMSHDLREAATQAETVGEKVLAALNQPYDLAGHAHRSAASIGIALFADHQESVDELLKRADLAMYQAKAAGRNTLCFFDPEMQAVVTARAALEAELREAVLKEEFLLHYQAQVVGEGRLTGAETLVRWQHPQRGLVSPAEFIPLAEDTGLILQIGHHVLETACRQLVAWAARPEMANLTISVNVSARQFRQPHFVGEVLAILQRTGANPHRLKLELTESLLVDDVEDIIAKMTALKAKGVGFSLDDFGTGYSSLSYLKRLPLDQLKIDQGFVRDLLSDPNDAAIAKMVVALAESLGLTVIAEGVEIEAQRTFLARLGCHAYQGYLFSRPLPLPEFEAYAERSLRAGG